MGSKATCCLNSPINDKGGYFVEDILYVKGRFYSYVLFTRVYTD